jgi:hypothetical protein
MLIGKSKKNLTIAHGFRMERSMPCYFLRCSDLVHRKLLLTPFLNSNSSEVSGMPRDDQDISAMHREISMIFDPEILFAKEVAPKFCTIRYCL